MIVTSRKRQLSRRRIARSPSCFTIVTLADVPLAELFDVSLSIDAHLASMARSGETAIAGVRHGRIALGQSVTWRARHFGIWFTMTSRITELDRPKRFVDEQVHGPFRSFRHEHVFERDGDATVMTDVVMVRSPLFGRIAERGILLPYLRWLIRRRNDHLLAEAGRATSPSASR